MKKIDNKGLRILGIVMAMIGIALLARPLIAMFLGSNLIFSFFGLFDGVPAIIVSVIILVFGLGIVAITEPLEEEK